MNAADASAVLHNFVALVQMPAVRHQFQRLDVDTPRNSARRTVEKNERRRLRYLHTAMREHGIIPKVLTTAQDRDTFKAIDNDDGKQAGDAFIRGINAVTRMLEDAISSARETSHEHTIMHRPSFILVCLGDLSPPSLVGHLPLLVATYNAMCAGNIHLIRLPSGSEEILSDALALRRCSVVSCDMDSLRRRGEVSLQGAVDALAQLFEVCNIKPMKMDWLEDAGRILQSKSRYLRLTEPHIKHLRSSKPTDMISKKVARRESRAKRKTVRLVRARSSRSGEQTR